MGGVIAVLGQGQRGWRIRGVGGVGMVQEEEGEGEGVEVEEAVAMGE